MATLPSLPLLRLVVLLLLRSPGVKGTIFSIANDCGYTVWPGILSGAGTAELETTGFSLESGETRSLQIPSSWSGRLWGRTHCSTDQNADRFSCVTGDCGSGKTECAGGGAAPPATLAEFTLDGNGGMDFFDVSLVDGYNLPMIIAPTEAAGGTCSTTGCVANLNGVCPSDLRVILSEVGKQIVACRSACETFGTPEFCCSGAYGNPNTCKPSSYSRFFKKACPRAYSYAFDDATSTFTCPTGVDYVITFCPNTRSKAAAESNPEAVGWPLINNTMMFMNPVISDAAEPTRLSATVTAAAAAVVSSGLWTLQRRWFF
ncbi:hypothetical protein HPP92_002401 [Vanilla planifolia]|uniref:Thaumatin-like protein 1 n=1 Tax=Vanilla planifolia TaxID=51239 RepID=A0A835VI02_VANPL|nr:hypothetical protein HPP92_002401 [Vanilla planifolia]